MSLASAIWTFVAWLFSAAIVGFAAAWLIQTLRMREGKALAHSLEIDSVRLRAAQDQMRLSLDRERSARVASDARLIEIQRELGQLRGQTADGLARRNEAPRDTHLLEDAEQRLQQALAQLGLTTQRTAELERECRGLRTALASHTDQQSALKQLQTTLAQEQAKLLAAQELISEERARLPDALAKLSEARAQLAQLDAKVAEARSELSHAHALLAEERTRLTDAHARLAEENTNLSRERAQLAEERDGLAAARSQLAEERAHREASASADPMEAAAPLLPAWNGEAPGTAQREDAELAQRMATQQLHELEEQVARGKRLAREHRAEVAGLKSRIKDLEERLNQLWAQQGSVTVGPE